MLDDPDINIARLAASQRSGSIVAAAGCGKTEQIVRATQLSEGRRLILTHTHAGEDALRLRLSRHHVPNRAFHVETIASWCLRYSSSFPKRSGLVCNTPKSEQEWSNVYEAAATLILSGAANGILSSSYSGVFVDEYQDCSVIQHQVIKAIATCLPVCVFGDPLQAIFDFKDKPVDWEIDVFPVFNKAGEMTTPWRWKNAGNVGLADWLAKVRTILERGGVVDLTSRPACVAWHQLPNDQRYRQATIVGACKAAMGKARNERLIIIADPANINARSALAQKLAKVSFSNIEPIGCQSLYKYAKAIESTVGFARLEECMDFVCACMTGADKSGFFKSVQSHQRGGKVGKLKFGDLIAIGSFVTETTASGPVLDLFHGFRCLTATQLYRREMFFAMCSALKIKSARNAEHLSDAIWDVQNRLRHSGRKIWNRSIGSTLLVKGLEFEHAVVIHADNMSRKDWYVALTRATTSLTIISPLPRI